MNSSFFRPLAMLVMVSILAAGCGGSGDAVPDAGAEAAEDGQITEEELDDLAKQAAEGLSENGEPNEDLQDSVDSILAGDSDYGSCTVSVSGDVEANWAGKGGAAAVGTDYWYSDDELRDQFEFLGSGDESFEDLMASGRPVFSLLLLNCSLDQYQSISLFVSDNATRSDLAFGPGSYEIAAGGLFGAPDAAADTFSALITLDQDAIWATTGGSLDITSWDAEHIAGSFSFGIDEALTDVARSGQVEGEFDFNCFGDGCS